MSKTLSTERKEILTGGLLSSTVDATIDHALSRMGVLYGVDVKDTAGHWIMGIGTGDIINIGIGAGLLYYGKKKRKEKLRNMGFGWLLAMATTKIAEFGNYLVAIDPTPLNGEWSVTIPLKTAQAKTASFARSNGRGSYNNPAPKTGAIGAYLKPPAWAYAPR